MNRKSTIAAQHVNMVDRVETAPRTIPPAFTFITITKGRKPAGTWDEAIFVRRNG